MLQDCSSSRRLCTSLQMFANVTECSTLLHRFLFKIVFCNVQCNFQCNFVKMVKLRSSASGHLVPVQSPRPTGRRSWGDSHARPLCLGGEGPRHDRPRRQAGGRVRKRYDRTKRVYPPRLANRQRFPAESDICSWRETARPLKRDTHQSEKHCS